MTPFLVSDDPVSELYLRTHLLYLSRTHRELGRTDESLKAARELATLARGKPSELYNAACALASIIPRAEENARQALAVEAVGTLREAIAAGWKDAAEARRDQELDSLRGRDDFRLLLLDLAFPADPFAR
jgi:eukaryotic-like serine/threonine-protein kinase